MKDLLNCLFGICNDPKPETYSVSVDNFTITLGDVMDNGQKVSKIYAKYYPNHGTVIRAYNSNGIEIFSALMKGNVKSINNA